MPKLFDRPIIVPVVLALLCLTPLLFPLHGMWDACLAEIGLWRHDLSIIDPWATAYGWYYSRYSYVLFDCLAQWTGIHYRLFFNVIMVLSILGLSRETYWLARDRFRLEREYALIAAWVVIAFPVWHILTSTALFANIVCMWAFMASVRWWFRNRVVSLLLFLFSAQLFSLFSLGVGFAVSEFLLTVNRLTFRKKFIQAFGVSLALLLGYLGLTSIITVQGNSGSYNTINLDKLEYFYVLLGYSAVLAGAGFLLSLRIRDAVEKEGFLRHFFALVALLFFAVLPYVAVNRPMRYFSFGSFTGRHTMLTVIPLALLLAVLIRHVANTVGKKTAQIGVAVLLLALVVLLHQGFSHKVAALVFKDMLTESLAGTIPPPSGYVAIEAKGYEPPRHVHGYAINALFHRAYGKTAWMSNGYWHRKMDLGPESLKKMYGDSRGRPVCQDVSGDAYTRYTFELTDYHQEGRFWYWYYYLASDYSAFKPRLTLVESLPGTAG